MTRFDPIEAPTAPTRISRVEVPGTGLAFTFVRDEGSGGLLQVRAEGRTYLETGRDGWTRLDGGLGRFREDRDETTLRRQVETAGAGWDEVYGFDADGRLAHVDGVDIHRDAEGRVTACLGGGDLPGHRWHYAYTGAGLVAIDGPDGGARHLSRLADGRVTAVRQGGASRRFAYDKRGRMRGIAALPEATHHRDGAGRLWAITGPAGQVVTTWLWDGWRCIGRIDGPPGAPLAAFFCLDPSATPVRVLTRQGPIRIPRDAYGEGLLAHEGVPGLFGAFQTRDAHHLPWRVLLPKIGAFAAPDPFDGSEDDPRRNGGTYEGDLDVETDRQRPYDVCRNDPVSRADPSGGISAGLLISSLTWSFQNNLLTFFGIDWWFNLFGSLFTGSNFFSSDGLVASDHIGAFGVLRDGVIPKITGGRAFTTQHIVWDTKENFDELNDGMVIDPGGPFDPPLMGGPLLAAPAGFRPFLLRGAPRGVSRNWNRNGGTAAPAFPGASQPVFPSGGFHFDRVERVRGPVACALTELIPAGGISTATAAAEATRQIFGVSEVAVPGLTPVQLAALDPVLLTHASGERLRTRALTLQRWGTDRGPFGTWTEVTVEAHVPDALGPTGIDLTKLDPATTRDDIEAAGAGVQGFSARGVTRSFTAAHWLEIRSRAGGDDVTMCQVTGAEARVPLNAPVPGAMTAPFTISETTLAPAVNVTLDGTDGLAFPASATPPASGIVGVVSDGTTHLPVRITDVSAAPVVRTDATLSALGAPGAAVTFRAASMTGLLGRRTGAPEADPWITYTPGTPGAAPDGSAGPVLVMIAGSGGLPDAPRIVTGAPIHDAILVDQPITPAAPWTVERWSLASGNPNILGLRTIEAIAVTPDDTGALTGALALRVLSLTGAGNVPTPQTVAVSNLAMSGASGSALVADTALTGAPRPTDLVALRQGGADTLHTVAGLRLSFAFDRDVEIDRATESYVVRLRPVGFDWDAERLADDRVVLRPVVDGARSQFPRIRTGAAIRLEWQDGGTRVVALYRVTAVDGMALTLDGPVPVAASLTPGSLTARLLEADNPLTGHQKIGINLDRPSGAGLREAEADVWSPDAFNAVGAGGGENGFGLVSRGITVPVVVQPGNRTLVVRFAGDTGLSGSADLQALQVLEQFEFPVTGALSEPLMLENSGTDLACVLVQPFVASEATVAGRLLPGDVIIPTEEGVEVTRRQALVDHELEHTAQYNKFGPIWFCYFPLFLAELPVELATDLDQPNFGPSVAGTLERTGARVRITPGASVDVSAGDVVQVFQGGDHERLTVASLDGSTLVMQGASALRAGAVELRKVHDDGIWSEVLLDIGRVTTHGGLLNTLVGFTWGGLLWLLSKGIYGAVRAMGGAGDQYPGDVVAAGSAIELTNDDGRRELNAEGQFIIKSGDTSVVRRATRSGTRLVLDQPIALTGAVQVSAYASLDPGATFDWLQYKPGTVDETNSAAITLASGEGSSFSVGDRVEYIYFDRSGRTHVSGVSGDRIELEDPIAVSGTERSIRVALLAEAGSTLANADEAALNWMGMGWMRVLFDPYGQIEARVRPEETWAVVLMRIMRVVMGSRNWSALPMLGYVFWARLFGIIPEHRAKIEQLSSEKSGDMYTPLARLNGEVTRENRFAETVMAVGDIARYRYWPWNRDRALSSIGSTADALLPGNDAADGNLGAPGLHVNNRGLIRVVTHRTAGTNPLMPNEATVTDGAVADGPARALPDVLFAKNANATLGALPTGETLGFAPADLGAVPLSVPLVRNPSAYVAFSRPGNHRATTTNTDHATMADGLADFDGLTEALDAQQHERQTIWFDVEARDVTVTVNGQEVAEGDTVTLVQTQTARVAVTVPGGVPVVARVFRASVRQPAGGATLRAPAPLRLVAQGANTGADPEPVEISRFYPFNATTGTYSDPALARFGLHLGGALDIPVRGFDVTVTDRLDLLAEARPDATVLTSLAQGQEGFLLIPTSAGEAVTMTFDGAPTPADAPELRFETRAANGEAATAIGPLGQVRCLRFDAGTPLAAPVAVVLTIPVTGEDGSVGQLQTSFTLTPP